jgi:hypothetical protein
VISLKEIWELVMLQPATLPSAASAIVASAVTWSARQRSLSDKVAQNSLLKKQLVDERQHSVVLSGELKETIDLNATLRAMCTVNVEKEREQTLQIRNLSDRYEKQLETNKWVTVNLAACTQREKDQAFTIKQQAEQIARLTAELSESIARERDGAQQSTGLAARNEQLAELVGRLLQAISNGGEKLKQLAGEHSKTYADLLEASARLEEVRNALKQNERREGMELIVGSLEKFVEILVRFHAGGSA